MTFRTTCTVVAYILNVMLQYGSHSKCATWAHDRRHSRRYIVLIIRPSFVWCRTTINRYKYNLPIRVPDWIVLDLCPYDSRGSSVPDRTGYWHQSLAFALALEVIVYSVECIWNEQKWHSEWAYSIRVAVVDLSFFVLHIAVYPSPRKFLRGQAIPYNTSRLQE